MWGHNNTCVHLSVQYGETALHKVSGAGQTAVVTLLLYHGADVHALTKVDDYSTALDVYSFPVLFCGYLHF